MAEFRDTRNPKKRLSRIGKSKSRVGKGGLRIGNIVFVSPKEVKRRQQAKARSDKKKAKSSTEKKKSKDEIAFDRRYAREQAIKTALEWKRKRYGPFAPASFLPSSQDIKARINALRSRTYDGEPLRLDPHQIDGVYYLAEAQNRLLFDDMGLGKTVQVLMALGNPRKCGVLIIVPLSVQMNWVREAQKWRPDFYNVEAVQADNFRWPRIGEIIVAKWHSLPAKGTTSPPPNAVHVVMDEAHLAKNPATQLSKNSRSLRAQCQACWVLTGTPMKNKPRDLYQVMRLAGYNRIFGPAATFEETFFKFSSEGKAIEGYEETRKALELVRLRRLKDVVPGLPPKRFTRHFVSLDSQELRRKCSKAMAIFGGEEGIRRVIEKSIGAKREGDRQDNIHSMRKLIANAKLPYVLERIDQLQGRGEPLVVFCYHKEIAQTIGSLPGWGLIYSQTGAGARLRISTDFNRGRLRGIAITEAGAVGINLQENCSHLIRVDLTFSPSINNQICDRVHRRGQKRRVTIEDIIADHPLDRIMHKILRRKERVMRSVDL